MHFGEEVSRKFLAMWPNFFKPRIIADCKNLPEIAHVDELHLSAKTESDNGGKCKSEIFFFMFCPVTTNHIYLVLLLTILQITLWFLD